MANEVAGIVVAPSVRTMGIVDPQDARHIEGPESTPLDTHRLHMVVGDQGGITLGRLLTLLTAAAAQIGGILVALGDIAPFNVLLWCD